MELIQRTYSRAELEAIFHTDRTDLYRKNLQRAGYTFESGGRGQGYWIKITGLPQPLSEFEEFVKREFTCGPQTNFKAMERYLFLLFFHEEYRYFPATYQAQFLEEVYEIKISDSTLRSWKKRLIDYNLITIDTEKVKYYACNRGKKPIEMKSEVYRKVWKEFYNRVEAGEDPGEVRRDIYYQNGGIPRKQFGFAENAITRDKLQELLHILEVSD